MRVNLEVQLPGLPKRRTLRIGLALVLGLGIAIPGVALASHQFGDVPFGNPFHNDIAAIADAGVTGGCGGGNYCPKDTVTREQMAAFMNRLGALSPGKTPVVNADRLDGLHANQLTRAAADYGVIGFDEAATTYVAEASITTGGAAGGTGLVMVTASVTAYTTSAGVCPCEFTVYVDGPATTSMAVYFDVSDTASPSGYRNGTGTVSWVFPAPNGTSRTYSLAVDVAATGVLPSFSADSAIEGEITVAYVPFGGTGGSGLSAEPGERRGEARPRPSAR